MKASKKNIPSIGGWPVGDVEPMRILPSSLKATINSDHPQEPFASIIDPCAPLAARETNVDGQSPRLKKCSQFSPSSENSYDWNHRDCTSSRVPEHLSTQLAAVGLSSELTGLVKGNFPLVGAARSWLKKVAGAGTNEQCSEEYELGTERGQNRLPAASFSCGHLHPVARNVGPSGSLNDDSVVLTQRELLGEP